MKLKCYFAFSWVKYEVKEKQYWILNHKKVAGGFELVLILNFLIISKI